MSIAQAQVRKPDGVFSAQYSWRNFQNMRQSAIPWLPLSADIKERILNQFP